MAKNPDSNNKDTFYSMWIPPWKDLPVSVDVELFYEIAES